MVLWVYARKHIDGIVAYLQGHKSQREDVRGRINDLIVYCIILRAMIEFSVLEEEPTGTVPGPLPPTVLIGERPEQIDD
jgi:hypothetical protein